MVIKNSCMQNNCKSGQVDVTERDSSASHLRLRSMQNTRIGSPTSKVTLLFTEALMQMTTVAQVLKLPVMLPGRIFPDQDGSKIKKRKKTSCVLLQSRSGRFHRQLRSETVGNSIET